MIKEFTIGLTYVNFYFYILYCFQGSIDLSIRVYLCVCVCMSDFMCVISRENISFKNNEYDEDEK